MNLSSEDKNDVEENKIFAVLSYIGVLVLVPLLAKKDSKFAMYHAKQGLVLLVAEIVTWICLVIPFLGWIVYVVGIITWVVLSVIGISNALGGKTKELPLVGQFAEKFKF